MSNLQNLIIGEAEIDEDEDEESYDEETGEVRQKPNGARPSNGVNGHLDDSSEEDEDDEDEEAERLVNTSTGLGFVFVVADCELFILPR